MNNILPKLAEDRLAALRLEWKTATPERRNQILIIVNRIKQSAHLYKPPKRTFKDQVMENLK